MEKDARAIAMGKSVITLNDSNDRYTADTSIGRANTTEKMEIASHDGKVVKMESGKENDKVAASEPFEGSKVDERSEAEEETTKDVVSELTVKKSHCARERERERERDYITSLSATRRICKRLFCVFITSSNRVDTGRLRSFTVDQVRLKLIEICPSVGPSIGRSVSLSVSATCYR